MAASYNRRLLREIKHQRRRHEVQLLLTLLYSAIIILTQNMATYFGEVLPLSSRAVDDDDEYIKLPEVIIEFQDNKEKDKKSDFDSALIAYGHTASMFAECYLLRDEANANHLGTIQLRFRERDDSNSNENYDRQQDVGKLYEVISEQKVKTLLCLCPKSGAILPEVAYSLTKLLFNLIKNPKECQTVIVTDLPSSSYKAEQPTNTLPTPFLRMLATSSCYNKATGEGSDDQVVSSNLQVLEVPNIISGFPAAIMTECEVMQIPAVLFICYSDITDSHVENCKVFLPILNNVQKMNKWTVNTDGEEKLLKLATKTVDHGNLYI